MAERITILGDGAMATVRAILLTQGGHQVTMWARSRSPSNACCRTARTGGLLPGARIPPEVRLTANDGDCFGGATMVLSAIPTQYMRSVWDRLAPHFPRGTPVVSVAKGSRTRRCCGRRR